MTKYHRVPVDDRFFTQLCRTGDKMMYEVIDGVPQDAKLLSISPAPHHRCYTLYFASETEGQELSEGDSLESIPEKAIALKGIEPGLDKQHIQGVIDSLRGEAAMRDDDYSVALDHLTERLNL